MIDVEQLKKLIREVVREELAAMRTVEPAHLTVAAYAAKHSLGASTVRQAIREGRLPAARIGRAVRIPSTATIARRAKQQTPSERAARILGGRP